MTDLIGIRYMRLLLEEIKKLMSYLPLNITINYIVYGIL